MIKLVDVSKHFGSHEALKHVNLEVPTGQKLVIIGPSGSGKSTLMHIAGCLDTPDAGEVWLSGRRVDGLRGRDLARLRGREVGFIFQGFNLVPTMSALENVALAAEYAGASRKSASVVAHALLEEVGLGDRVRHLPSELSGGQQQRVAIARALVKNPRLLLCDEPTGSLDSETGRLILALLEAVNSEYRTTVVVVTHNAAIADMGGRVARMSSGRIAGITVNESPLPPERISW